MNDCPSSPDVTLQATSARIDRDLYCVRCEYNLRTLTPDALCPECAFPVAESLRDEINPLRKRLLRRYLGLYLLGTVIALLSGLFSYGGYLAFRLNGGTPVMLIEWPSMILRWAVVLIGTVAILQLTRRRMLVRGGPHYPVLRGVLRLGVIFTLFMQLGGYQVVGLLYGSDWYVVAQIMSILIYGGLIVLLLYYLWRLLAPCLLVIVRRLRLWAGLTIAQCAIAIILWLVPFLTGHSIWGSVSSNTPLPSPVDLAQLGLHVLHWAVTIVGIMALIAIRRHLGRYTGI